MSGHFTDAELAEQDDAIARQLRDEEYAQRNLNPAPVELHPLFEELLRAHRVMPSEVKK